jgi:hypothetical protein
MLSTLEIENAKSRFLFIATIVILSEIIEFYLKEKDIFTKEWLYSSLSLLIAYIIFILLKDNISLVGKNNYSVKKHERNFIRQTTLFLLSHIIKNYLEHGMVNFDLSYLIKIIISIIFYVFPDYILQDKLLPLNSHQYLMYDVIKMFISDYTVSLMVYNIYKLDDFYESFSFLSSYILWETFIKNLFI